MKKYLSRNSLILSVVFGLMSLLTVWSGIQFNLPGTGVATDPREIFNAIGSALSGPVGGIIIAVLSTLKGSNPDLYLYITFQHIVSAVWVGWAFKNLGYKKFRMPALAGIWIFIMFVYYFPAYIPGYTLLYLFNPELWHKFVGPDFNFWSATIKIFSGWMPEIILTTFFTTMCIVAIPHNYRKPQWDMEDKSEEITSRGIDKNNRLFRLFDRNFIALRLAIWFILLFSIAIFYISIITRNYFSDYVHKEKILSQKFIAVKLAAQVDNIEDELLEEFIENINLSKDREVILTDKNLIPVYGNWEMDFDKEQKEMILREKEGGWVDGKNKISVGFAYCGNKDMYVVEVSEYIEDYGSLNSIVDFMFENLSVIFIIISTLGAGIIYFLVGKPITKLTEVAKEIGRQNYSVEVNSESMTDEIEELANAVDEMKTNIQYARNGLLENKQRLDTLSKATFEGIAITENGIIVDANDQLAELYGYNKEELIGMSVIDLIADESKDIVRAAIKSKSERPYEHFAVKKDGTKIPVEVRPRKHIENNREFRITAIRDITAIKNFQSELIASKELAERSNRLKSEFLAQMSHEIRSPLNIMLSFLSLVKEETKPTASEDIKECFASIETAGKRIIRTVDLLLNMAEIQAGSFEPDFHKIDLYDDIIKKIIKEYELVIKENNLELLIEVKSQNSIITADSYSISQVFVNLLDNAIKYTNSGYIKVIIERNDNDNLQLKIEDSGIGIAEEYLPNIFESFSQEEQGYTRRFEGNGLGLALVKKYCEINNAEISVKSIKDKGTTFTVTFN